MSKKISDFFKTLPKFNQDLELIQENLKTPAEVKNEREEYFEINLNEVEQKLAKNEEQTLNSSELRECRMILEDIKQIVPNGNLTINKSEPKSKLNSRQSEMTENCIKNNPRTQKIKCKCCGRNFHNQYILDHMNRVHSEEMKDEQNGCEICNRKFLNLKSLMFHLNYKHSKEYFPTSDNLECDFDGKIFNTKRKLQIHMQCHQSKVKCELCQKEYIRSKFGRHIRDVHTEDRKFQCKICPKIFKSVRAIKDHIRNHNKEFECSMCSKLFPTQGHLNIHMKQDHRNSNSFECEICDKKFNRKFSLKSHQKTHDKNRPKPFKCQRCDYSTDIKPNYKVHQKFHERQDKKFAAMKNPLKCEKCYTFCKNRVALSDHMRHVHPEVPYQCDLCGMYIKIKFDIKKHILLHLKNQEI